MQDLEKFAQQSVEQINQIENFSDLEKVKVSIFGKNGALTALLNNIKNLSSEEKPIFGQKINDIKSNLQALFREKKILLENEAIDSKLQNSSLDVSLMGSPSCEIGVLHPVTQFADKVISFFESIGYDVYAGPKDSPELETELNNFTNLNFNEDHPAKSEHDTFYLNIPKLLRTHTSTVQVHQLTGLSTAKSFISYGKVYRSDTIDSTHSPMFHQLECVCIDRRTNFSQLKGMLQTFLNYIFETDVEIRFRVSYFPFTEPSAEVDIRLPQTKTHPGTDWIEVLGCGMIHPNVLDKCNVQDGMRGYAFGIGIERLLMLKLQIPSLRSFYDNDIRFLNQIRGII